MRAGTPAELRRVEALHALKLLDTPTEDRFDRITRVAAALFDVPIALINFVDTDRQWSKSCIGLAGREAPRSTSFCSVAIQEAAPLVVPDTRQDARFAAYANVVGDPHLRFYAGVPVRTSEGAAVGTLCIADRRPRTLDERGLALLTDLARMVDDEIARTDLATALAAQRESEAWARAVMDNVAEGIITFGEDGIIRSANPAAERAFSAPGGLAGRHVEYILAGVPWEAVKAQLPEVLGRRRLVEARRSDGSEFPLELVLSEAEVAGERLLIAIGQDVTERRRAQAALRESEQRFRAVFDDAAIGMLVVDRERRIVRANPSLGELLDVPARDLAGRSVQDILEPSVNFSMLDELFAGAREGYRREQRLRRFDGTMMWGAVTVSVMRDAEGRPRHAVGMIEDITERKEVERLKDEFVSVVGHELRTPLTSIRGSLGLLDGGLAGDLGDEARDMVRMALDNTNRLVRLVEDTLDLERMQAGAGDLELRPVPVQELADAAVGVVQRLTDEAGLVLATEIEALNVSADPDRVVQALTNLIGNAVKFSPEGGTITLAVRRRGRDAEFSVRDEGRGIPPEKLEAIFERFRQVDSSDRREKGGTGLGLAIAREIVQRSGGRIWVESEPGQGSTFSFTLPIAREAVAVAVLDRRGEPRAALAARVGALGMRAVPVADAAALAEAAREGPIAAVVLAAGPSAVRAIEALDAQPGMAAIPKVLVEPDDDDGLLPALEASVPSLRAGRVLVVEDDADLGRLLVSGLEHRGLDVELARTGREAREAIERRAPGVVILDIVLPGEDGYAVVDWLRRTGRLADVPLLVYSARDIRPEQRARLQLGKTEFLEKAAASPADVERRAAELLGAAGAGEEVEA